MHRDVWLQCAVYLGQWLDLGITLKGPQCGSLSVLRNISGHVLCQRLCLVSVRKGDGWVGNQARVLRTNLNINSKVAGRILDLLKAKYLFKTRV